MNDAVAEAARTDQSIHPSAGIDSPGAPQPSSISEVRGAYLDQAVIGYLIYSVGVVSAFLAVTLSLSDGQAGLHSSAFAIGIVLAGVSGERIDGAIGTKTSHIGTLVALGAAVLLIAWAPTFAVTLTGAATVGVGTGLLLGHINRTVSAGGGALARVRLARSTLVEMVASLAVPIAVGLGDSSDLGWQVFAVPALVLVGASVLAARRRPAPATEVPVSGALPGRYWVAWSLVALFIAVEYATVVWSSSIIESQTGASLSSATLVLAAFVLSVIVGRSTLSLHAVSRLDPILILRIGIGAALAGTLLMWGSTSMEVSVAGLVVAGLGLGVLYPLAASIALASAPKQAQRASIRLVLASGVAILVAPLVLGLVADSTGIVSAWLLIPAMCVAGFALTVPIARFASRF